MEPITSGLILIAVLVFFVALGIPVALSMGVVAFGGMWLVADLNFAWGMFKTLPYNTVSQYAFVVAPMFVLMGALAAQARITSELYTAAYRFLSGVRGSLYYATTLASAGFAAVSGSTVVASAVFTRMAMPEMIRFGFNRGVGAGCIAAAGTFAALIPPSLSMVIYGILTGQSIGRLLIAGIIPGLLTAAVYLIGLRGFLQIRRDWAPEAVERFSWGEKLSSLKGIWALLLLVTIVLGSIYAGFMPPSAAGTIGAAGALAICLLRSRLTTQTFWAALKDSAAITGVLFLIVISGMLFSRALLATGFVGELTDFVQDRELSPVFLMTALVIMYFILGMFVDTVSMMVMTIPFVFPMTQALGLDPIWFGVVVIKLVEIAAITPPVGLNLYAVLSAARGEVKSGELFVGVMPFVFLELVVLALIIAFPQLSLWLPDAMIR